MKKIRVAINGFGRIGRCVTKVLLEKYSEKVDIVAINDLTDTATLSHLFTYDSFFGVYPTPMEMIGDGEVRVGAQSIRMYMEREPAHLPWKSLDIDVVLECTGIFNTSETSRDHIDAGAKRVILSAPPKDDTPMFIMGVNEHEYTEDMTIISNASCTTNCLAPIVHVLHSTFGIRSGVMNTVHSYTQDQRLQDAPHKDLRRARNAQMSIVPTTTGAARSIGKIIPALKGKLDGISLRVPTPDVSIVDFTCILDRNTSIEEVHDVFKKYAEEGNKNILALSDKPLVSVDYKKNPHSCTVDMLSTMVIEGNMLKVLAWYDNEWGYSTRLADLLHHISTQ